jgi:tetratricopeptide (TPR) repeat protein
MKPALLIMCLLLASQTAWDGGVLQPPRKGLVALHAPDLTSAEESVREQVRELQNSLGAAAKNPATSATALSETYGQLGEIYHAYSLMAPARECYLNANQLAANDFRWLYLLAKLDQQEGRYDDAIRRYRAALGLRPDYVAATVNLGNIFLELNQLDEAVKSFNAALAIDANNAAVHYGLGQIALSRRAYAEAVTHFEKTLSQTPSANRVHYSLAMAYRGLRNADKVKTHLAQQGTVGVRVTDPVVDRLQDLIAGERLYLSRGKVAFEAQRYADAAVEFRKAVAAKPDSVTARVNLGAALSQTGDLSGAVEQFEAAIRIEPEKANAHYNLAVLLARQNKHSEAIAHLYSTLKAEPGDVSARYLLAQELVKSDLLDDAVTEFSRVVQAVPDNESALLELVKLLHHKRQFKRALDLLEQHHAQYPQRGRTVALLAYLLSRSPQTELRDGARALELAQRVFNATGASQHGALVAFALAELGRCGEAAKLQQQMIAAAEQQGKHDLARKLKTDLKPYQNTPCRLTGETMIPELLL